MRTRWLVLALLACGGTPIPGPDGGSAGRGSAPMGGTFDLAFTTCP